MRESKERGWKECERMEKREWKERMESENG
jgi:hypothetical protein